MKLKIIIAFVVLVPLLALAKPLETQMLEIIPSELSVAGQIEYYSNLYGADSKIVSKVIQCESRGNITAIGDSGKSFGIAQFQKPTFINLSNKLGEELDYYSSHDQIKLLSWSMANGYGRLWTAYRAIMNNGSYSFYSSQLNKHFTVSCR
ncbi:MAG TPA: hypothetical protein DCS12_08565 [Clostridiales bacterium]|nr:hypothetical protein [Clostridiales bacterium]